MGNALNLVLPTSKPCNESSAKRAKEDPIFRKSHIEEALQSLDNKKWHNVLQFLRPWGPQQVMLIHVIVYRGNLEMLKRADTLNLDLCARDGLRRCALHYAAEQGHADVLNWLLERLCKNSRTSRRDLFDKLQQLLLPANQVHAQEYARCRRMFDVQDEDGWTPLHAAVYGGNLECVRILIKEGLSLASKTRCGVTAADAIFDRVPHPITFLEEIFNQQITASDSSGNKVILDFQPLVAPPSSQCPELEFETDSDLDVVSALINAVSNLEEMEILHHPLVATFLHKKYLASTPLDLLHLLLHVWFVSYLSCHAVCVESMNVQCMIRTILIPPLTSAAILLLDLMRIMDGIRGVNSRFVRNKFSVCTGVLISTTNFVIAVIFLDVSLESQSSSYEYPPVLLHAVGVSILLAWTNILLALGRFPLLGEYARVFFTVLSNVGKILLALCCLVITFAFSFMVIFYGTSQLSTPWKTLTRSLVVMTGGYDYDSLFLSDRYNSTKHNSRSKQEDHIAPLPVTVTIIFFIFVLVNGIGLMIVMVGSAVTDIRELLKESRTRRLLKQADAALHWIGPGSFVSEIFSKPGRFTKMASRTLELDLQSSSWIPCCAIPKDLKEALRHLALKNLKRDEKPQPESTNPSNTAESLAAIQASLERIEKRILNSQMQRMAEDSKTKMQRRSM